MVAKPQFSITVSPAIDRHTRLIHMTAPQSLHHVFNGNLQTVRVQVNQLSAFRNRRSIATPDEQYSSLDESVDTIDEVGAVLNSDLSHHGFPCCIDRCFSGSGYATVPAKRIAHNVVRNTELGLRHTIRSFEESIWIRRRTHPRRLVRRNDPCVSHKFGYC